MQRYSRIWFFLLLVALKHNHAFDYETLGQSQFPTKIAAKDHAAFHKAERYEMNRQCEFFVANLGALLLQLLLIILNVPIDMIDRP